MIYLAFLSIDISLKLYQDWLPYAFGLISGQRYMNIVQETYQADRILPKWPGSPNRPVPTTEATYRMILLLITCVFSTWAVLASSRIKRSHGHMLLFWTSVFFLLPVIEYWANNSHETGLLFAPLFTLLYGFICYIVIVFRTLGQSSEAQPKAKAE